METSNIIALGALIVAFIALIPTYYQAFYQNKKTKPKNKSSKTSDKKNISVDKYSQTDNKTDSNQINADKTTGDIKADEKPMPTMLRVIVLALTGVIIGLVELIIFSGIAYLCGVKVDLATMSLVWTIVFYALFIVPAVFFWFAFCTFTTMLTD